MVSPGGMPSVREFPLKTCIQLYTFALCSCATCVQPRRLAYSLLIPADSCDMSMCMSTAQVRTRVLIAAFPSNILHKKAFVSHGGRLDLEQKFS